MKALDKNSYIALNKDLMTFPQSNPIKGDICFLSDIDNADAGYLFVTEENQMRRLAIFFWRQGEDLRQLGFITHEFTNVGEKSGPNFLFIDKYLDDYYLGIANAHDEECA